MLETRLKHTAKCSLTIENPAVGLVLTTIVGHAELACVQAMWDYMDEVFTTQTPIHTFHDWSGLNGYDADIRPAYVVWSRSRRSHFRTVNILTRSRLLAMGVSVANLALGYLTAYTDREAFNQARERTLAAAGNRG